MEFLETIDTRWNIKTFMITDDFYTLEGESPWDDSLEP